jgi:hypothetical protein
MSTRTHTSNRGHIDTKFPRVDQKGGNHTADIEKMTEAEPVVSSNPPKISFFPGEFFNNIGHEPSSAKSTCLLQSRHSRLPAGKLHAGQ